MIDARWKMMKIVFGELQACAPERDAEGNFDESAQLVKVKREYKEAAEAWEKWIASGSKKDEVDYLEEIVDTMTALATLFWAHTHTRGEGDPDARAMDVIEMVNLKNRLRGYHDFEEEGEKK